MLKWLFTFALLLLLFLTFPYLYISISTYSDCTDDPDKLGEDMLMVVLGTSRRLEDGSPNLFYRYRIEAAIELYRTGKVSGVVVSGHGQDKYYNEPREMENDLVAAGVPQNLIRRDADGLRTILSVRALLEENKEHNVVFVSQRFHNERAVFLASREGMQTRGFNAQNPHWRFMTRVLAREVLARQLAFWETLF